MIQTQDDNVANSSCCCAMSCRHRYEWFWALQQQFYVTI